MKYNRDALRASQIEYIKTYSDIRLQLRLIKVNGFYKVQRKDRLLVNKWSDWSTILEYSEAKYVNARPAAIIEYNKLFNKHFSPSEVKNEK